MDSVRSFGMCSYEGPGNTVLRIVSRVAIIFTVYYNEIQILKKEAGK